MPPHNLILYHPFPILKLTQVNTMARITNTTVPGIERVKNMYSIWGRTYIHNDLRIFLLKYYNNILGLGNRIVTLSRTPKNQQAGSGAGKFRAFIFCMPGDTRFIKKILPKVHCKRSDRRNLFYRIRYPWKRKRKCVILSSPRHF
jgi:hypothetical protein